MFRLNSIWLAVCMAMPVVAMADSYPLPDITVVGKVPQNSNVTEVNTDALASDNNQDVADLLKQVPGVAVVRNGAQTGIVQLRGLF
ncbi:MAG: TonB-dependent receptor plug domain-containing protein, partial [Sulfuriferula sp.]